MPFPNIGAPELILILVIALIILGPGKLPDVASSLGRSVREFRKAATDVKESASLEPTAQSSAQASSPAPATGPVAPPAPNQVTTPVEPNRLSEPPPTPVGTGSEQHPGSASS